MAGLIGSAGFIGFFLTVFLIYCIYSAQKWAYKCYLELQKLNRRIELTPPSFPSPK